MDDDDDNKADANPEGVEYSKLFSRTIFLKRPGTSISTFAGNNKYYIAG